MISVFGTSLGTSAPWLLVAIPLATSILIYTFRARGSGNTTVTSSLFILSKLPRYLPARKSFSPPLQFWLELAAFLLLSLAAAGLTATSVGKKLALVIDSSTSMSALTPGQSTKLEEAKRLARADIAREPPTTRFAVFSAHSALHPVTDGAVSSSTASSSLQSIEQAHSPDTLASSLSSLLGDATYDGIWVYTDKKREDSQHAARVRVNSIPFDVVSSHNLWIHSLAVSDIDGKPHLRVEVFSSDDRPSRPNITATCESQSPQESFSLSVISPAVSKPQPATTTLGPLKPSWSSCALTITADPRENADAISLDNTAYIVNNPSSTGILVVSELSPASLGLTRLTNYSFLPSTSPSIGEVMKTIYHRVAPKTLPSSSALVVLPPPGRLPWKGGEALATPQSGPQQNGTMEISRWTENHPILRYAQPQLLSIPSARVLVCPDSATPILYSRYGPLLCAGEENGSRYAIVGFELFPFDGIKSPTLSVLTLNTLTWLFSQETVNNQNSQLFTKLLNNQTVVERLVPAPRHIEPSQRAKAIQNPGIFKLTSASDRDTRVELFATNSLVDEESDIARERTLAISSQPQQSTPAADQDFPLERALAAMALLVLFIDLARRLRRRGEWGNA